MKKKENKQSFSEKKREREPEREKKLGGGELI